jgi:hypothetical protein
VDPVKVKCQRTGEVLELFGHRNKDLRARFDAAMDRARNNLDADRSALKAAERAFDRVLAGTPYLS